MPATVGWALVAYGILALCLSAIFRAMGVRHWIASAVLISVVMAVVVYVLTID